jgi:phospholipid/cholesterol/gamma-HCH transport system substrate-binding protein
LTGYVKSVSLDDLTAQLSTVATQVEEITSALADTFATDEAKADMRAIVTNLRDSTSSLKQILEGNQSQINTLVSRLNNIAGTVDNITTSRESDLNEMIINLKDMSASMKSFSGNLDGLLSEEQEDVAQTITNLRDLTAKAQVAVDNINRITQDAYDGKGTIGMLLSDNETRDSLKNTITTLGDMVDKANRITVTLEGGYEYLSELEDNRGRFDVKIQPSPQRYYLLGVANNPAGTTSKSLRQVWVDGPGGTSYYTEREYNTKENPVVFSLQYAYIFNKLITARGGLFDSQLGFAVDVHPLMDDMERLKLTMQASDFDRDDGTYFKFNTRYRFMDNFFVQAGWDDIGTGHSNFTAGGGIIIRDDDIKSLIGSMPMPSMGQ